MSNEPLRFELRLNRRDVVLVDPETDEEKNYYLLELDGTERDGYLNTVSSRIRVGADGKGQVKNFDGFQATLIAKSLHDADTNEKVQLKVIQKFPAKVQGALFKAAQDLSGLDLEVEGEEEKNS